MEDLETLRLLGRVVPEYSEPAGRVDEASIQAGSFNIVFAFDECLTLGYKDNVTLQQVKVQMEMDRCPRSRTAVVPDRRAPGRGTRAEARCTPPPPPP